MMRVLITTLHVNPLVPVAQALEAAGHEVAFACSEDNRPEMEAIGFRFFPAGTSMRALMPLVMTIPEEQRNFWVLREAFGRILPEAMVSDLIVICRTWEPDVIVRDMTEIGGGLVAERLGLPHASVEVGAFLSAPSIADLMGDNVERLRAGLGLPSDPTLAMLYRYLHLSFAPPAYQDPAEPLPTTAHALQTLIFDRSGEEGLPDWAGKLPHQPTIYATLGTGFNRFTEVFAATIAGLRDEPANLIVTVGRDQDPAQFGPQPPNVRIERYIPQSLLFPSCDLVICHGGWNTVLAALGHGLPLVVIPLGADQPQNAERCANLGVGRVITPVRRTPDAIRDAVREVLRVPGYRRQAERLRDEMLALPGSEHAVALLERLVNEKAPLIVAA